MYKIVIYKYFHARKIKHTTTRKTFVSKFGVLTLQILLWFCKISYGLLLPTLNRSLGSYLYEFNLLIFCASVNKFFSLSSLLLNIIKWLYFFNICIMVIFRNTCMNQDIDMPWTASEVVAGSSWATKMIRLTVASK